MPAAAERRQQEARVGARQFWEGQAASEGAQCCRKGLFPCFFSFFRFFLSFVSLRSFVSFVIAPWHIPLGRRVFVQARTCVVAGAVVAVAETRTGGTSKVVDRTPMSVWEARCLIRTRERQCGFSKKTCGVLSAGGLDEEIPGRSVAAPSRGKA